MFLRYIAAVLMLSSILVYANPIDPYTILQKWNQGERAKKGETSTVMMSLSGLWKDFLGDNKEGDKPLLERLPKRGTLYRVITEDQKNTDNPNQDKLAFFVKQTLQHHRGLLDLFGNPAMNTPETAEAIRKAFPELKTK